MPFVIRSYPRCGTHMLRTALDAHPEITCHNEIFNPDVTPPEKLAEIGAEELYRRHASGKCEGFVVHGYTELEAFAEVGRHAELWDFLEREKPTLFVVEREDLLRRAFSVYQARKTQRWHVWKSNVGENKLGVPEVPPVAVEWQLKCAVYSKRASRERFPWAEFYTYEQIVDDWDQQIAKMQRSIGVSTIIPIKPKTAKQDQRPIHEMVSNYRYLKDYFARSEWGKWFEVAEQNDERRAV